MKCNNSRFGTQNLLQLNGTATGAPNSCLYADLAVKVCSDTDDLSRNIRFIYIDQLTNTNNLSPVDIDILLLQKERFWISTLVTIHKGLNSTHDWNRKRRTERPKQR